jgi:hypothetical protein
LIQNSKYKEQLGVVKQDIQTATNLAELTEALKMAATISDRLDHGKKKAFLNFFDMAYEAKLAGDWSTGRSVYSLLTDVKGSAREASEYLSKKGVPGIAYQDGAQKYMNHPNYVLFDPSMVKVIGREELK